MASFKQYLHNRVQQYIDAHDLFSKKDSLLLTVSGGVDSMVLVFILQKLGYSFSVAHCNFQLRGADSEEDEKFVRDYCQQYQIPFYTQRFNTKEKSEKEGISIQMAARELRYDWFQELADENQLDYILTAHHADDQVETFLMHIVRGTGLKGLTGISSKKERIIRPLLFAFKDEILEYATKNNIPFRTDKSNDDTKYQRNYLRHEIIPNLTKINPNIRHTIIEEVQTFQGIYKFYQQGIQRLKTELVHLHETEDANKISILELAGRNIEAPILYEILRDFQFNMDQVQAIFDALNEQSGKQFISPTHTLIIDRAFLIIRETTETQIIKRTIFEDDILFSSFPELQFSILNQWNMDEIIKAKDKKTAYFDYDLLTFPLTFRNWENGDKLQPLGMKGLKKVSDILIDEKIDLHQKQSTFILKQNEEILWLCGIRQSNYCKINSSTKHVLKVSLK